VFDIFDLAFSKIVDPTIFVRDLSFVWRASHEIFPLRGNFRRPLPPVHEVASHRRFCESSTSTVAASREGRRGGSDGSLLASRRVKEGEDAAMDCISQLRAGKEKRWREERRRRRGGKKSSRGEEESSRETTAARGEVAHDKESRKLGISKLSSHCAYAKMSSLVHQMLSLSKCISQMHNCLRAIFKVFGKFLECIIQLHNR